MSPFGRDHEWPELGEPFVVPIEHRNGEAIISKRLRWRLAPMIGTLACAPEWETLATATAQGAFGGNLDVSEYCVGATVTLASFHEGGLLFVGDVHGCQGDGEYSGAADETRAEVRLAVRSADGPPLPYPRVVTPERIIALFADKPLEAAAHGAVRQLMLWLVDEFDFTRREAYCLVSLHPEFRIRVHQMTSIQGLSYVVGASVPREALG
jgi:acetamidase/formamidase